jgi:RteC protein
MKEEWFIMYESMLRDMEACGDREPDLRTYIECCFSICQQYWSKIEQNIEEYLFQSPRDEIEFYKTVKPLFKSQLEYYNLLYHAEIFKPVEKPGEMKEFWLKEQQRLDKFIQDNPDFYAYHKSGATHKDEINFLEVNSSEDSAKEAYYDDLIASLLALEKYSLYTHEELSRLKGR